MNNYADMLRFTLDKSHGAGTHQKLNHSGTNNNLEVGEDETQNNIALINKIAQTHSNGDMAIDINSINRLKVREFEMESKLGRGMSAIAEAEEPDTFRPIDFFSHFNKQNNENRPSEAIFKSDKPYVPPMVKEGYEELQQHLMGNTTTQSFSHQSILTSLDKLRKLNAELEARNNIMKKGILVSRHGSQNPLLNPFAISLSTNGANFASKPTLASPKHTFGYSLPQHKPSTRSPVQINFTQSSAKSKSKSKSKHTSTPRYDGPSHIRKFTHTSERSPQAPYKETRDRDVNTKNGFRIPNNFTPKSLTEEDRGKGWSFTQTTRGGASTYRGMLASKKAGLSSTHLHQRVTPERSARRKKRHTSQNSGTTGWDLVWDKSAMPYEGTEAAEHNPPSTTSSSSKFTKKLEKGVQVNSKVDDLKSKQITYYRQSAKSNIRPRKDGSTRNPLSAFSGKGENYKGEKESRSKNPHLKSAAEARPSWDRDKPKSHGVLRSTVTTQEASHRQEVERYYVRFTRLSIEELREQARLNKQTVSEVLSLLRQISDRDTLILKHLDRKMHDNMDERISSRDISKAAEHMFKGRKKLRPK